MKPCNHGNHPFSYCQECCREMNAQVKAEENSGTVCARCSETCREIYSRGNEVFCSETCANDYNT